MFSFFRRQTAADVPLGQLGEQLGCRYLKKKGYRILDTNYKNTRGYRLGEIDIVAEKDHEVVFVEVKTRLVESGDGTDILPETAINASKLHKLERIASQYLRTRKRSDAAYHFDALSILYNALDKTASIRHLEHIFL